MKHGVNFLLLSLALLWVSALTNLVAAEERVFNSPGNGPFTIPDDVAAVTVEAWGGGGSGGAVTPRGATGGGGGGAYARSVVLVEPGDQLTYRVGLGGASGQSAEDSWARLNGSVVVRAEAGANVPTDRSQGARGGRAAQSIGNQAVFSGGSGADGQNGGYFGALVGGGGGSSAGREQDGNPGSGSSPGSAPPGGGDGGAGGGSILIFGGSGETGSQPGGGGGGAGTGLFGGGSGGAGGDGLIRVVYTAEGGCDASFPDGISSYNGGNIDFGYNSQLIGSPDGTLSAGTISRNAGSNTGTCGSVDCEAGDSGASPLNLPPFPTIGAPADSSVSAGYDQSVTVGDEGNRFSQISTGFLSTLTFSSNQDTYYIGSLALGSSSQVYLRPGDYYIESISVNNQVDVQVLGTGTARLFIKGNVNLGSRSFLNSPGTDQSGNVSKLLLASYGDISLNNNATVSGAVFALGDINLGSASYVYGGATAGNITLRARSKLYFESQGMADVDFGGVCDGEQGEQVDHFLILHGGTGVTCQPTPITFEARDAQGDIVTDYDGQVALSTSTGQGFWQVLGGSAGNLTLVPGDTGEASFQFDPADGGVVTLGLQHTQPDTVNLNITDGDAEELPSADPDLLVQKAGFIFHQRNDFSVPIGSQVSGKSSNVAPGAQDLRLTAVRENDDTGTCEAFLVDSQPVSVGQACESPGNCSASGIMEVNGTAVAKNSAGSDENSTSVTFDFGDDATSSAPLALKYNDAGLVSLFARMPLVDDEGNPTREVIEGSSGPFPVIPAGFCVEASAPGLACATVDAECSVGGVAGEVFNLDVSAVAWESAGESGTDFCDNSVTPNFEYAGLPLEHGLLAPVTGEKGSLLNSSVSLLSPDEGTREVNQSVSEVGVFEFSVPAGEPYLGQSLPGGVSAPVGRFTPAGFTVLDDAGTLGAACPAPVGFTYVGQSFGWSVAPELVITPLAADETSVTSNYLIDDFMKLTVSGITRTDPDADLSARLADDSDFVPIDYSAGEGTVLRDVSQQAVLFQYDSGDTFLVDKSLNTRIAPFTPSLQFSVDSIVDQDGVTTLATQPMPVEFQPSSEGDLRYGRLDIENVYGPENTQQPLDMAFQATYWNGAQFVRNSADSCTTWDTSIPDPLRDEEQYHELLNDSETGSLVDGEGPPLRLQPSGQRGEERIRWQMPVWLKGYWGREPDSAGDPAVDELQDPVGVATFGVYRGNDRIIYWQEVLN